ncbi:MULTISPECIES: hypothetical protein [Vibrio]|uniref:hypothetical protein n=1 Tax=Vibrio TaxID=662 RepID=UPI0005FA836E|nr:MULTISPECIES: hypothetical protein [Vibrio]KJY93973.1 hypothetical protein TW84_01630 [Vibrio neptunius]MCG9680467.1 hypothetical protein [Vibrio sp. Isolate24]
MENEILGYVVCHTCKTPKAIKQGKGKRKAFVHGRCQCGPDTRTGAAMQAEMNAYKSLEEVEAEIEALAAPKPEVAPVVNQRESNPNQESQSETQSKPISTAQCVGTGAMIGLVFGGVFKVLKAVA